MAEKRISPASGSTYNGDVYYYTEVVVFTANGTILVGSPVMYDSSAAGKVIACSVSVNDQVVGVALEAAVAGGAVEVCVKGVCDARVDGDSTDVTAGQGLNAISALFQSGSTYAASDRFVALEANDSTVALKKIAIVQ